MHIVDRAKDMIIRGGENVYCVEVEGALYEHPAVADCAVIGVPHPVLGEEVGAVVVLRPGTTSGPTSWPGSSPSGWPPSTCPPDSGSGPSRSPAIRPARSSSASCAPSSSATRRRSEAQRHPVGIDVTSGRAGSGVDGSFQPLPGDGHIALHLADEIVHRLEGQLLPEMGDERHPGLLGVEIAGEVEHEGLDQQRPVGAVERRAPADRDGRLPDRTVRTLVPAGVDPAAGRQMAIGDIDIGGGKTELGSPRWSPWTTLPLTWWGRPSRTAASSTRPSPTRLRMRVEEMAPTAGLGRVGPEGHALDLEPGFGSHLREQGHVSLAPVAEVEVLPHHHQAGAEAPRPGPRRRSPQPSRWPDRRRRARPPSGPPRPTRAAPASGRDHTGAWAPTRGGPRWPGAGRR